MRIGWGYDIHPCKAGKRLVLGGVSIPSDKGLEGHSDADVLIHAICDAILGAMGGGDLGRHFPDTDPRFAGIESTRFLQEIARIAKSEGYRIHNLDATIIAQRPRLSEFLVHMAEHIAKTLELEVRRVNVKATSPEGIGALGRAEAIAAQCVVLLEESPTSTA